jgi:hypothetical protein
MESTMRAPQAGDMVLVLAKMKSGRLTAFNGYIEDVSADHPLLALDSIHLIEEDYEEPPVESKIWPKTATKLLKVEVPLDKITPFDGGKLDQNDPCWEVKI